MAPPDKASLRRLLTEAFLKSRPEIEAVLVQCFTNPQRECVEQRARLEGELP